MSVGSLGSNTSQPARISGNEPAKNIAGQPKTEEKRSETIIEQENDHKKSVQPGVANNDLNRIKSLEEIDVKA